MRSIILALLLSACTALAIADDQALPLAKRVGIEKVLLAEQFQKQLQQCREEKRKAVRERCQSKRRAEFDDLMTALHDAPRDYFRSKEQQGRDEQMARQSGKSN